MWELRLLSFAWQPLSTLLDKQGLSSVSKADTVLPLENLMQNSDPHIYNVSRWKPRKKSKQNNKEMERKGLNDGTLVSIVLVKLSEGEAFM